MDKEKKLVDRDYDNADPCCVTIEILNSAYVNVSNEASASDEGTNCSDMDQHLNLQLN